MKTNIVIVTDTQAQYYIRLARPVQIAQHVTADSYPSTPYPLPIPSAIPIKRC